jgi:hypothetical protein
MPIIDRLKKSLEQLQPPICPACEVEMKWTRSELLQPEPVNTYSTVMLASASNKPNRC